MQENYKPSVWLNRLSEHRTSLYNVEIWLKIGNDNVMAMFNSYSDFILSRQFKISIRKRRPMQC